MTELTGHAGQLAVAVAQAHGVETMFTLSGAHVFPMYDGAVKSQEEGNGPPVRLVDVRHEQTAAFAAEATGKLTRVPGLAVLTAGPGVTNGVSAMAQATFAGSPMVVVGGPLPSSWLLTAPSYIGKTCAPERVNIVSTPCACATATASSPAWPWRSVPGTAVASAGAELSSGEVVVTSAP